MKFTVGHHKYVTIQHDFLSQYLVTGKSIPSYLMCLYSFLIQQGNIYIERQYIITKCFWWIILHIQQYNITSTPPQSHPLASLCLSNAIRPPERHHANEYDFQWITIHIGQFIVLMKPIMSYRKAHRSSSCITIFSFKAIMTMKRHLAISTNFQWINIHSEYISVMCYLNNRNLK